MVLTEFKFQTTGLRDNTYHSGSWKRSFQQDLSPKVNQFDLQSVLFEKEILHLHVPMEDPWERHLTATSMVCLVNSSLEEAAVVFPKNEHVLGGWKVLQDHYVMVRVVLSVQQLNHVRTAWGSLLSGSPLEEMVWDEQAIDKRL